MKRFDFDSILLMSEVLDKTGIIIDINEVIKGIKTDELKSLGDAQKIGKEVGISIVVQLAGSFMKSMHKAGPEIKELIAHLSEKSVEDVGKMTFKEIKQFFVELINAEGFSDFFKQAVESVE